MGDPKRLRKKYETPVHPWQAERIAIEKALVKEYGLKNKKEVWKAQTLLRRFKDRAKQLIALDEETRNRLKQELIRKMASLGLLSMDADIDDVLGVDVRAVLDRRLQTIVYRKGLARSVRQARQFIVHGHILVGNKKVTSPGYLVRIDEEDSIGYTERIAEKLELMVKQSIQQPIQEQKPIQDQAAGEVEQ